MEGKIITKDLGNGAYQIHISNMIDEEMVFPTDFPNLRALTIDLGETTYINSTGIRNWIRWMNELHQKASGLKLEVHRLPLPFIRAIDVIRAVLPTSAVVHSFSFDAFCEECNEEISKMVDNSPGMQLPKIPCPTCGKAMEAQLMPESYRALMTKTSS